MPFATKQAPKNLKKYSVPVLTREILETPKPEVPVSSDELRQRITQEAYRLYQQRGGENGHDMEDWLAAEEAILGKKVAAVS